MKRLWQAVRSRDERGVTLVEVSLTMLILAIVLMVALDFLDRTSATTVRTDNHARAEDETQRALRTVTQHLRGASPIAGTCATAGFSTSYKNCVQFDVPRAASGTATCNVLTRFVIGLVPHPTRAGEHQLKYTRQELTGTTTCTTGAVSSQRLLLDRVVNDTQVPPLPVFSYFGPAGNEIDPAAVASVPKAATVRVSLAVRYQSSAPPIVLTTSAALRNNITR